MSARTRLRLAARLPSLVDPVARWWARQPRPVQGRGDGLAAAGVRGPRTRSTLSTATGRACSSSRSAIYILLALGLNIVVGQAGLLDLGYVAFYAVGRLHDGQAHDDGRAGRRGRRSPWPSSLAMVAGVLLGAPTLRLRGDYLAIVTLGFGEIVRIVAQNTESLGEARGITGIPHPRPVLGAEFGLDAAAVLLPDPGRHRAGGGHDRAPQPVAGRAGRGPPSGRTRTRPRPWACPPSR